MQKMDLSKLQTRKMKGLKRKLWPSSDAEQSTRSLPAAGDSSSPKKRRSTADDDMETD